MDKLNTATQQDTLGDIGIRGAYVEPLKIIAAPGGPVLRMLRKDSPLLPKFADGFGEIYFSEIETGQIKAWKMHKEQNQLFTVPVGRIKIALYDARGASFTLGSLVVMELGRPDNYKLLRIPAGVWYGLQAMGDTPALICNLADMVHDPGECQRLPPKNDVIPFEF